jgi:hypothetical protein
MDILEKLLNTSGTVQAPPHGPRSQGGADVVAIEDEHRTQSLLTLQIPEPGPDVRVDVVVSSPVLTALVAFHDEGLLVCSDSRVDAARTKWVRDIKQDYQGLRLVGKRPWPEFYGALVSGGLRRPDCEAVWNLRGIAVVTHDCFPVQIGGARLETEVLDANTGARCTLGSLCEVSKFDPTDDQSVRKAATRLFLNATGPLPTLLSKMATRTAHNVKMTNGP